ncbi:hypothetical protein ACFC96_43370 [Streptomyces sp. NPDC055955]|uniref:hypothetical protein n=1 Tax=Streptomyces sp. NPDC055955 TaxID=3345665 RepID=UPI0035D708C7
MLPVVAAIAGSTMGSRARAAASTTAFSGAWQAPEAAVRRRGVGGVAEEGDAAADVPAGTTSAYYRTRQALFTPPVRRLVERDQTELHAEGEEVPSLRDMGQLASQTAEFMEQGRGLRSLACDARAVGSVRHPEPGDILAPRENAARDAVREVLSPHGAADAEDRRLTRRRASTG